MVFKSITTVLFVLVATLAVGQTDYKGEFGIALGSSFYLGETNKTLFQDNSLTYGLLYRHKLNERLSLSGMYNTTTLENISFRQPVKALDVSGEFNFFDYEDKVYRPNSRKHTLYLHAGFGAIFSTYAGQPATGFSVPAGLGYKIMLGKVMHLNFIWVHRLMLNDKLEGLSVHNDPRGLNGSNFFNNDMMSTISVALTVNVFKECWDCRQLVN